VNNTHRYLLRSKLPAVLLVAGHLDGDGLHQHRTETHKARAFVNGRRPQFYVNRRQPQFVCNWKKNKARLGVEVGEKRIIQAQLLRLGKNTTE
jgi:hypothetical protein